MNFTVDVVERITGGGSAAGGTLVVGDPELKCTLYTVQIHCKYNVEYATRYTAQLYSVTLLSYIRGFEFFIFLDSWRGPPSNRVTAIFVSHCIQCSCMPPPSVKLHLTTVCWIHKSLGPANKVTEVTLLLRRWYVL